MRLGIHRQCQELALKDGALSEAGVCRCGPESTKARCLHNIAKHFGRPGELH
jgi:hypothetical protein